MRRPKNEKKLDSYRVREECVVVVGPTQDLPARGGRSDKEEEVGKGPHRARPQSG